MASAFVLDIRLIGYLMGIYSFYYIVDLSYRIFVKKERIYWNLKGIPLNKLCTLGPDIYWTTIAITFLLLWLSLEILARTGGG